jgi:Zn finger protein HypA/HybF involved in hydrogenase expression
MSALTHEELQGIIEMIDNYAKNAATQQVPKFDLEVGHLFKKKQWNLNQMFGIS